MMVASKKDEKFEHSMKRAGYGGLFIPAGLFLGMGVGFAINNIAAGLFGGLGAGFLCFAIVAVLKRD